MFDTLSTIRPAAPVLLSTLAAGRDFSAPRPLRPITTRGGGVIIRARAGESVSLEEIAARAPSVFADGAHESRSARYEYTDTRDVLGGLLREGFKIAEVRQGGSRIEGKRDFTKHALRLTAPESYSVTTRRGDVSQAQVILRNSHDGTSSYQLRAGLYRFVCLNGLVIGDDFENFRIGHTKGARDKIIDAAFRVVGEFPEVADAVREMDGLDLSRGEQMAFAEAAAQLRWAPATTAEGAPKAPPVEPVRLLDARRAADTGADLWAVMNRTQENLIKGGQRYRHEGERNGRRTVSRRTVGAVNSIEQDSAINRALWTLSREMQKLKAAA